MKKLFIIGNGFDIAHNLKTSYEDFHKYLLSKYCYKEESFTIPDSIMLPDGGETYDNDEVITILIDLISEARGLGKKWSDIETCLGLLNLNLYLDDYNDIYGENDDDLFKRAYMYEDISKNLYDCVVKIKEFFAEWVDTIEISSCEKKHKLVWLLKNNKNIFMSFNYTTVLERIYNVKNVFHIHGIQGGNIVIGHGKDEIKYRSNHIGAEYKVEQIHEDLRKNTEEIIKSHEFFKIDLNNIDEIYSYGFSFSEVDLPYINEICKKMNTKNIIWFLSDFESENTREEYKDKIIKCGFKGAFREFNI